VLAELVPGGFGKEITAGQAARVLQAITPASPAAARCELAAEFLADLRRLDAQRRDTRTKLAAAVRESGTTLTQVFGVGPVIAAAILGATGHAGRFGNQDRFAAYNGTAPIEVSSGGRKIHRLSLRGNRRLNHAIHMAAVTQIRHSHSPGRAYFDRKIAEGKTGKEALRALKRQLSDVIYARLQADAIGERLCLQRGQLTPQAPALRTSHSRTTTQPTTSRPGPAGSASDAGQELTQSPLTTKRSL